MQPRRCDVKGLISSWRWSMPAAVRTTRFSRHARSISCSAVTITISSSNSTAATPWRNRATTPTMSPQSTSPSTSRRRTAAAAWTWWPQFRIIDTATVKPDPEVAAVVAKYEGELGKELDDALGTTAVALDSRTATVRTREAAIGNLVADAMRASTHADAAVTNGG